MEEGARFGGGGVVVVVCPGSLGGRSLCAVSGEEQEEGGGKEGRGSGERVIQRSSRGAREGNWGGGGPCPVSDSEASRAE